ncbi:hypothetical protein Y1Q_0021658 [Alligator mississippiensis]|uniref:Uncharacterized protein n=1 Tax=Alligator mississippiensis TaxID=8496 RepID=A0A151PAM1_ALLMI|nr:hypothetical protein Y1Q_0021658 [Alligator mississippiensis]
MRSNASGLNGSLAGLGLQRPPWVASTLAAILIFTIVVDILGNVLVILSVCRNKKLRNAAIQVQYPFNISSLPLCDTGD